MESKWIKSLKGFSFTPRVRLTCSNAMQHLHERRYYITWPSGVAINSGRLLIRYSDKRSHVQVHSAWESVCPLFLSGRSSRVGAWANWNKLTGGSTNRTPTRKSPPKQQPITTRCGRNPSPNFTRRHRLKTKPRWNLPVWTGFNRLRVSCLREERRRRHTTSTPPRWKIIRVTN